jgi:predicted nucleotidyltransferase
MNTPNLNAMRLNPIGLRHQDVEIVQNILKSCAIDPQSVRIFGSRAMGTYQPASDLDLVVYGDVSTQTLAHLSTCFEDSYLTITVDVLVYNSIQNPKLKSHIDTHSIPWPIPT